MKHRNGNIWLHLVRGVVQQIQIDADQQTTLLSRCPGLRNIIQWLDSIDRRPGLSELESKLSSQEFEINALRDCIGSTDDGYQRNVIKRTQHYEIVAICWRPGQLTPIHDHKGSDCAFLILEGVSTERIFEIDQLGKAVHTSTRHYSPGEICAAEEPDIHQVVNEQEFELVNLHIYTPPLSEFMIYAPAE